MANEMMTFTGENDTVVSPITFNGDVYFVAKDIGAALGYHGEGRKMVNKITQDWSSEFIEGTDFVRLSGKKLREFNALRVEGPDSGPSNSRALLVLTESGVNLACMKTNKPIGVALRRWLADVVLPALRRGDAETLTRATEPLSEKGRIALDRERRLTAKLALDAQRFEAQQAKAKAAALAALATDDTLTLDPAARQALKVRAAQFVVGEDLGHLAIASDERLYTATQVAKMLASETGAKITANRVGRWVSDLGLRGNEKYTREVLDVAAGVSGKTVKATRITEAGLVLLRRHAKEWSGDPSPLPPTPPALPGLDCAADA